MDECGDGLADLDENSVAEVCLLPRGMSFAAFAATASLSRVARMPRILQLQWFQGTEYSISTIFFSIPLFSAVLMF